MLHLVRLGSESILELLHILLELILALEEGMHVFGFGGESLLLARVVLLDCFLLEINLRIVREVTIPPKPE